MKYTAFCEKNNSDYAIVFLLPIYKIYVICNAAVSMSRIRDTKNK